MSSPSSGLEAGLPKPILTLDSTFHSQNRVSRPALMEASTTSTTNRTSLTANSYVPTSDFETLSTTNSPTTDIPTSDFETLSTTNSPTTTPHSIAHIQSSTIDGSSAEKVSVEPSSPRVEHMRSRFCVSDGFDLSNTSDNSTLRVHSIPLTVWGDKNLPTTKSRTSLPATSGLSPSRKRIMDIGENPNMIPEDLLKLQTRGIKETELTFMTSPLTFDQVASGIFRSNEIVSEILPSTSSKSTISASSSRDDRTVHAAASSVPAHITSLSLDIEELRGS